MAEAARTLGGARVDLLAVAEMVAPGAKVLDVGCGDGELLRLLVETRGVDGRGIELSREGVNECVAKGLAVIQGDADTDLSDYPDDAFDYVILSQTLQATRHPRVVLEHMLRIGRHAIVSFPNFGHWGIRLQLLLGAIHPCQQLGQLFCHAMVLPCFAYAFILFTIYARTRVLIWCQHSTPPAAFFLQSRQLHRIARGGSRTIRWSPSRRSTIRSSP